MLRALMLSFCLASSSYAADFTADFQKCRQLASDSQRLQCYDQLQLPVAAEHKAQPLAVAAATAVVSAVPASQDPNKFGQKISIDEQGPAQLELTISALTLDAYNKYKLIMSNGQVWKQTESGAMQLKAGDVCIISKGALGSFYLQKKGSSKKIRVKRQE